MIITPVITKSNTNAIVSVGPLRIGPPSRMVFPRQSHFITIHRIVFFFKPESVCIAEVNFIANSRSHMLAVNGDFVDVSSCLFILKLRVRNTFAASDCTLPLTRL